MSTLGTVVRGIKAPVIVKGDNLVSIVTDSLFKSAETEGFTFGDRDVIAVTEAIVARAQNNYCSVENIAKDVREKFSVDTIGLTLPILSRNRFATCLKGIAMGMKKIYLQFSFPADEVGNHLFDEDLLDEKNVNPYSDVLSEEKYREIFGFPKHPFTGMDYVEYYKSIITEAGCEVEIIFANQVKTILDYVPYVLTCDIHTRERSRRMLQKYGAKKVLTLSDILTSSVDGSGYNEKFGLLGSNKATDNDVKLFPRDCDSFVLSLAKNLKDKTGKNIEVMIYGDGAFKDPKGKIWELADPVVSPAFTPGLTGTPNEIKLKYLADNNFSHLKGAELDEAIKKSISQKDADLKNNMLSQGTTPREIPSLIGSLCDLTTGSGDKGTPIVLVQGYFDNYAK